MADLLKGIRLEKGSLLAQRLAYSSVTSFQAGIQRRHAIGSPRMFPDLRKSKRKPLGRQRLLLTIFSNAAIERNWLAAYGTTLVSQVGISNQCLTTFILLV